MHRLLLALIFAASTAQAAEWRIERVNAPARVLAVETVAGEVRVNAGGLWYKLTAAGGKASLAFIDTPPKAERPEGALPDGKVATGSRDIARAWLAEPTTRYDHGILGDKIEAASLVVETRDGKRQTVRLKDDAVFEDLEPRLADLDGDGHDSIVVVKSSLKRGSSLAVIAARRGKYDIVAETPPLGAPHRWLDPAGIADFTGDGKPHLTLVRQPHVVGVLELWSWNGGAFRKIAELPDIANHIAGTRAIDMAAVADFDGDKIPDIAAPSLDRTHLRIVSFAPHPREIASVTLPAAAATNLGLVAQGAGPPGIAVGLADGSLAVIRRVP
ncbi:MAG TPA: VCBS repeat-containing protein [Pseudolabrys sp.]|nr:VCBS repeat-containing protein [Pseudolabrys sp.]